MASLVIFFLLITILSFSFTFAFTTSPVISLKLAGLDGSVLVEEFAQPDSINRHMTVMARICIFSN